MAAQKRSSNRNYIDLVEDGGDERRPAEWQPIPQHPIRDYLLGLVAAVRSPRGEVR
jgi:hypothetical protein